LSGQISNAKRQRCSFIYRGSLKNSTFKQAKRADKLK